MDESASTEYLEIYLDKFRFRVKRGYIYTKGLRKGGTLGKLETMRANLAEEDRKRQAEGGGNG